MTTNPGEPLPERPELEESATRYLEIGQHILFAILLVLGTARATQTARGEGASSTAVLLIGAGLLGVWYVVGAVMGRAHRRQAARREATTAGPKPWSSRSGLLWFALLLLGWGTLICVSADFSWVAFALFLLTIHMLPTRAALPVIVALTCAVVAVQLRTSTAGTMGAVVGPVIGAVIAVGAGHIYQRILAESENRRRLAAALLAAQDGLVAAHDELAHAQREAGVLAERQRLARDIHDTLAQGFSSILLLSRAGLAGEPSRDLLTQIETTASENLDEARRVVHALTPATLESAPLAAALERLLARLTEQTGITSRLTSDGDLDLPTTAEVALLRVAQSALANVRLHSSASRVQVTLTGGDDAVTLDVVDDGTGFDPDAPLTRVDGSGFGLRAMRERLAELGGTLVVESTPGEGTALLASIPLDRSTP